MLTTDIRRPELKVLTHQQHKLPEIQAINLQ